MKQASRGRWVAAALSLSLSLLLAGCGGGSNSVSLQQPGVESLSVADVQQVIAEAVGEAQARKAQATIAVVDRVGNVLGVFKMDPNASFVIDGGRGATGGLEGVSIVPPELAAISKAITAAYFSSTANAFSTRSAGQLLQEHFDPGESGQPAGPLFTVQFSQLTCSDVSQQAVAGTVGPKRSPLGFAADPGGFPLYKNGALVGAIGVISDGLYSVVTDYITDTSPDQDELIAFAGTVGFAPAATIRADHIAVNGRVLVYDNSEALASDPASATPLTELPATAGSLVAVGGYVDASVHAGTIYGQPASGIRPADPATDPQDFVNVGASVLVDATNTNRYPPIAGTDGLLTQDEVIQLLTSAIQVANRTRAQIRQPSGSPAQVSAAVVDTQGVILGYVRSPDALVDSVDVVVQKARTAAFFSSLDAAAQLQTLAPANYALGEVSSELSPISAYVSAAQSFFGDPTAFENGIAFSTRSLTALSTPLYPDGVDGTSGGPFSKPDDNWSIFTNGLQLDLVYNKLLASLASGDTSTGCTGLARINNGVSFFGGGFPIYRGNQLVGAIGVSGDGTQQSDLVAFLAIAQAGQAVGGDIGNAPPAMRADTLAPQGARLIYASCPVSPFIDSTIQNACDGL